MAVAAASMVMLGGSIVGASAANAAVTGDPCTQTDYTVLNGTTVVFTFSAGCTLSSVNSAIGYEGAVIDTSGMTGATGTLSITITGDGQWVVMIPSSGAAEQWITSCDLLDRPDFYLNHVILCDPAAPIDQTPPPVGQGVGLPASGSCADVDDSKLDFAADIKGGWTKSWEPWANPNGAEGDKWGWACVRTLVYSGSGWQVQAA